MAAWARPLACRTAHLGDEGTLVVEASDAAGQLDASDGEHGWHIAVETHNTESGAGRELVATAPCSMICYQPTIATREHNQRGGLWSAQGELHTPCTPNGICTVVCMLHCTVNACSTVRPPRAESP